MKLNLPQNNEKDIHTISLLVKHVYLFVYCQRRYIRVYKFSWIYQNGQFRMY